MTIIIRPATYDDVCALQMPEDLDEQGVDIVDAALQRAWDDKKSMLAFVGVGEDHQLFGLCGLSVLWPGVAEAWLAVGQPWVDADIGTRIALARRSLAVIKGWECVADLWRMQIHVDQNKIDHIRFAEYLGFEEEARLSKYLPCGGDALIYARVAS